MRALSHTDTSAANLLNSLTCVSSSLDHLLTISSIVFPRNKEGGGTATAGDVEDPRADVPSRPPEEKSEKHNRC